GGAEERGDGGVVVVAPDEADVLAEDAPAVRLRGAEAAPSEVAQHPEGVLLLDARVDGVEQGVVVAADGALADAPRAAQALAGALPLLAREEGAVAVFDDVAVAEVGVGGEPDGHGASPCSHLSRTAGRRGEVRPRREV